MRQPPAARPTAPAAARLPGQLSRPASKASGGRTAAAAAEGDMKGRQAGQLAPAAAAVAGSADSAQLKAAIQQLQAQISEETSELKRIMAAATTSVTRVSAPCRLCQLVHVMVCQYLKLPFHASDLLLDSLIQPDPC